MFVGLEADELNVIALIGRLAWADEFWIGATDDETTEDAAVLAAGDVTADPEGKPEPDGLADTTDDCLGEADILADEKPELTAIGAEAEEDPA